jgi:hypothetical protein
MNSASWSSTPPKNVSKNPLMDWTDKIADSTLCDYFYFFFVLFAIWAAVSLLGGIFIFATTKLPLQMLIVMTFNILLSFGISATSSLFLYLICERALKPAIASQSQPTPDY